MKMFRAKITTAESLDETLVSIQKGGGLIHNVMAIVGQMGGDIKDDGKGTNTLNMGISGSFVITYFEEVQA